MAIITWEDTLGCLAIESRGDDHFTAPNIPMPYYRIFGGQLLAQAIAIATATGEGKRVKSMHVIFPRAGDLREPVDYAVHRVQSGRSFATQWIVGSQDAKAIFTASISLHAPEPGPVHQIEAPEVGGPEEARGVDLSMIPWETRMVGAADLESRDVGPPRLEFWMRTPALPEEPAQSEVHQALFSHATDLTMIGTALRPFDGLCESDSPDRITTAVTTHSLWFHRDFRVDDWLLLAQEAAVVAGARGFGRGHAFTRAGELVASFAQESLIREVA